MEGDADDDLRRREERATAVMAVEAPAVRGGRSGGCCVRNGISGLPFIVSVLPEPAPIPIPVPVPVLDLAAIS